MARLIICIVLALGLIGLATTEQIVIQGTYDRLDDKATALTARVRQLSDAKLPIDTEQNIREANEMYEWWLVRERRLSMLARHFDLAQVSDAIIYAKNFIEFDNDEEAMAGLLRLRYLIKTHSFNVGTSIQNVI